MSKTAVNAPLQTDGLTSFGFLNDTDEPHGSAFALGSLFSRVKSALSGSSSTDHSSAPSSEQTSPSQLKTLNPLSHSQHSSQPISANADSETANGRRRPSSRKVSVSRTIRGLSSVDEFSESAELQRASSPHRSATVDPAADKRQKARISPNRAKRHDLDVSSTAQAPLSAKSSSVATPTLATLISNMRSNNDANLHSTFANQSRASTALFSKGVPLPLRTVAPASSITFASPAHAFTHKAHVNGISSVTMDDHDGVVADGSERDADLSRDTLTGLRNGLFDSSHWSSNGWSMIPGFPLSKDILADDARSVQSGSSRMPRSDTFEDISHHTPPTFSAARAGLQTSADAIIRRMRGEGLSKKFWMADENAKECRECLTIFTPFRRKHHCRICGQIFCSRCAPHIVKGNRFDYEGMIRVCNFCMRMLEEYDRHDAQVQQHANRTGALGLRASKNPNRVLPDKGMISAPLEAQIISPQAQFAANHLFASATAGPGAFSMGLVTLPSFASGITNLDSEDEQDLETSLQLSATTSAGQPLNHQDGTSTAVAPFRKGRLDEDELEIGAASDVATVAQFVGANLDSQPTPETESVSKPLPPSHPSSKLNILQTISQSANTNRDHSFVVLPLQAADYPRLRLVHDTNPRQPSQRSRARTRNPLALESFQNFAIHRSKADSGAETGRDSPLMQGDKSEAIQDQTAIPDPSNDLGDGTLRITPALLASSISPHALDHLTRMMEQTLAQQSVPNVKIWLDVLIPIVLNAIARVKPDPSETECMDVRQFIKIKRIPGGKPTDCEYVDGFVCSKNVATKNMARALPLLNARIMVVKFPLDYHRAPNQFMSLEPLMAQEHEFIRILVARIVALRPQIVVVEKTVSRIALDLLEKAGVVVVWSLKPSAVEAISRCTQADVITSIDRLALDPRLGRCHFFNVETYERHFAPSRKKSFMRFEGTPKNLGCTIILRGANGAWLSQIKSILELMIFVAYNLRLEEHVMTDEGAAIEAIYQLDRFPCIKNDPGLDGSSGLAGKLQDSWTEEEMILGMEASNHDERAFILRARKTIVRALRIYQETLVSSLACIQLPPPYPIWRLKQENDRLLQLRNQKEAEELERILKDEGKVDLNQESEASDKEAGNDGTTPTATPIEPSHSEQVQLNDVLPASVNPSENSSIRNTDPIAEEHESSSADDGDTTPSAIPNPDTPRRSYILPNTDSQPTPSIQLNADPQRRPSRLSDSDSQRRPSAPHTPRTLDCGMENRSQLFSSIHLSRSISVPVTPKLSPSSMKDYFGFKDGSAKASVSEAPTRSSSPGPHSTLSSVVPMLSNFSDLAKNHTNPLIALLRAPSDVATEAEYSLALERHSTMLNEWKRYMDIESNSITPFAYQRICMLASKFCTPTQKPCEGPKLETIEFYSSNDETLGAQLEELARNSAKNCSVKGCGKNNVLHYNTYVHNGVRIQVVLERFVCPIPGEENRLLSWSYCKVCENATPVAFVTQETWSFSFAKYLELHFYRHDNCKTKLCDHDFYRDQVRYFAFQNLAVRFHSEEVELYEAAVPNIKLFICPTIQTNLKNEEFILFSNKNQAYWDSVLARIRGLSNDACSDAAGLNKEKNRTLVGDMVKQCEADRTEIEAMVARLYASTPPTDVLCLNHARRVLQENVVKWDVDFIDFEKNCLPSEKDLRRITTTHLKRLFLERDSSDSRAVGEGGSSFLPPAAEIDESTAEGISEGKDEGSLTSENQALETGSIGPKSLTEMDLSPAPLGQDATLKTNEPEAEPATPDKEGLDENPSMKDAADGTPKAKSAIALKPFRDGNDEDTDVADLSPSELRAALSTDRRDKAALTVPSSPASSITRLRGPFAHAFLRADESSCTESEIVGSVSSLVRRFESPRRPPIGPHLVTAQPVRDKVSIPRRPALRRGKTEEPGLLTGPSLRKEMTANPAKLIVDSQRPIKSPPIHQGASQPSSRATSPTRRAAQSQRSRVPRMKRGDSASSVGTVDRRKSGDSTLASCPPPPSSYKPPKGEGLKAGPRPIVGRSAASLARNKGSNSGRASSSGLCDVVQSSVGASILRHGTSGAGVIGTASRVPVAKRTDNGPGTRNRVSTIARHFDRISREAERERERQQRMLIAQRAKRARPVAMTRAKVEVFNSIKEAVRDDESECETAESGDDSASAADNEDEGDESDGGNDEANHGRKKGKSNFTTKNGQREEKRTASDQTFADDKNARASTSHRTNLNDRCDTIRRAEGKQSRTPSTDTQSNNSTIKGPYTKENRTTTGSSMMELHPSGLACDVESDAQSITPSSITNSNLSSTLPSYLRNSIFSENDSTMGLEKSFLKTLSGFWAFRSGEMVPLEYPMLNSEHVFTDSDIIFREDEPSSIVAFTLSSTQYTDRLKTMQNEISRIQEKEEAFMPGHASAAGSDGWGMIDVEGFELESVLKKEGTHFRCEFESGSTRLWCKILFAEQFDALRRSCSCEHSFIESLSRCVKWDSSGGKSGSAFLKTRDDRFVVKQLSRFEMDTFSQFAPQYFHYMSQCFSTGRKTTLAKIFGCFRIGFRNPQTGKSLKMDCLVMENLFYGRQITKIYDLKGSMRNRHIQETGRANEVLLDENLVELGYQSPLFIREHDKRLLRSALYNDSLFLADMNVMDYSLVVGLDKQNHQLVVGIIDFVRTFTWDKRVESFVKETALLGGAGKGEPTIITPRQYRIRFLSFLDKSFLLMPDYWVARDWAQ